MYGYCHVLLVHRHIPLKFLSLKLLVKCTTTKMYYYTSSYSHVLLLRRILRACMATAMYYYGDVLLHDQI